MLLPLLLFSHLPVDAAAMIGAPITPEVPEGVSVEAPPPAPLEPWSTTPAMRDWLEHEVRNVGTEDQRMLRLLHALERRHLVYDDTSTGTAAEVFQSGRFNCLGVAHLVVGLARELGIDAYYVRVASPDTFGQRGDLVLAASHIAAGWGPPAQIRIVEYGVGDESRSRPLGAMTDTRAVSLHYANRGAEMLVLGEAELARQWLVAALQLDPQAGAAWVNLGVARRRLGRADAAEEAYLQALALDPGDRSALQNLATLEQISGDEGRARSMLQTLARARHRNPLTYLALGDLHLRSGQPAEAGPFYRRAVRLGGDSATVLAARGQWHLALGDPEAARRWLDRARGLDPADARVRALQSALADTDR